MWGFRARSQRGPRVWWGVLLGASMVAWAQGHYTSYTVRDGDTLTTIAEKHGLTVNELCAINGLHREEGVIPGEVLQIPLAPKEEAFTAVFSGRREARVTFHHHTVAEGENLESIAAQYKITPEQLREINGIRPREDVVPGEVLWIEEGFDDGLTGEELAAAAQELDYDPHIVAAGDTLESIAAQHGVSVEQLREANFFDRDDLMVGEVLYIPRGVAEKATERVTPEGPPPSNRFLIGCLGIVTTQKAPIQPYCDLYSLPLHECQAQEPVIITHRHGSWYAVLLQGDRYGWIHCQYVELTEFPEYREQPLPPLPDPRPPVQYTPYGRAIVQAAFEYLGVPYVFGGTSLRGIDCSGLVLNALYKATGKRMPRTAALQHRVGQPIWKKEDLQPGDRVYFNFGRLAKGLADHTGIYIGGGKMIHASAGKSHRVVVQPLFTRYYLRAWLDPARR